MKTDNFEIKFIDTAKKHKMFQSNDRVLVGLSGGKDSVALLYALNRLSSYFGISLVAFHLNHGIRGGEADSDEAFSKAFCENLSVPFVSSYVDVPSKLADSTDGLEALARDVRYAEFSRVATEYGCNKIATAHTAGDNTETVIMTMMRNSYAKGIPPVRDNIVRPLIYHSTPEVLDYCKRNSLDFVTDSTNCDNSYTRNFIRNNVLKELYKLAPSLDDSTGNFANIQRSNVALTEYAAEKFFRDNTSPMGLSALTELAGNVAFYNVLFTVITRFFNIKLSYRQFDDVVEMLINGKTGSRVEVSKGRFLIRDYDELRLVEDEAPAPDYCFALKFGKNPIPDSDICLWVETEEQYKERTKEKSLNKLKINKLTKNILIKYNIMNSSLVARSRKSGDQLICRGITRSVKKFMIDEKIPPSLRSRIPIVCDAEGIVWVPGLGLADRMSNAQPDETVVSLSLEL